MLSKRITKLGVVFLVLVFFSVHVAFGADLSEIKKKGCNKTPWGTLCQFCNWKWRWLFCGFNKIVCKVYRC